MNKTMHQEDITALDYQIQHIYNINALLTGTQKRFEHPYRIWEYGLALDVLRSNNTKTVLDVGGGGSVFAPAVAWLDMDILQVDPGDVGQWIRDQEAVIHKSLPFQQIDFFDFESKECYDAVTCLSVIEHVPNDIQFFERLGTFVKRGGLLVLTTDFHPSGIAQVDGHIRTYNDTTLRDLAAVLSPRFVFYNEDPDYTYENTLSVNSYTFASLILKRIK